MSNIAYLFAMLIDEPFLLRFDEIEKLTDRQIFQLYLRPRGKDGIPKAFAEPEVYRKVLDVDKIKEEYIAMGQALGIPLAAWKDPRDCE